MNLTLLLLRQRSPHRFSLILILYFGFLHKKLFFLLLLVPSWEPESYAVVPGLFHTLQPHPWLRHRLRVSQQSRCADAHLLRLRDLTWKHRGQRREWSAYAQPISDAKNRCRECWLKGNQQFLACYIYSVIRLDVNETVMYFFLLFGTGFPTVLIIQCSLTVTFHLTLTVMNHS